MKILLWTENLLTRSNLEATWRNHGAQVLGEDATETADLILLDISATDAIEHISRLRQQNPVAEIISFGPHVDGDAFKQARAGGATSQVARSKVLDRVLSKLRERSRERP